VVSPNRSSKADRRPVSSHAGQNPFPRMNASSSAFLMLSGVLLTTGLYFIEQRIVNPFSQKFSVFNNRVESHFHIRPQRVADGFGL